MEKSKWTFGPTQYVHVSLTQTPTPPSGKTLRVSIMPSHHITHRHYILSVEVYLPKCSRESKLLLSPNRQWGWGGRSDIRKISLTSRSFGTIHGTHALLCTPKKKVKLVFQFDVLGWVLRNMKNKNLTPSRAAQDCSIITTRLLPLFIFPFHFY